MTVIFDPFAAQIVPITNGSTDGPQFAYWSPDGASACGHTGYGESDLNFAESPGWIFTKAIEDTGTVARCAWIDRQNVAFTVNASRPDSDGDRVPENFVELYVLERATGQARLIAEFGQGISIVSAGLEAIPASRWLVTQNRVTERGAFEDYLSQPEVFDVDSGARTPVLQQGDWIIAVLPP